MNLYKVTEDLSEGEYIIDECIYIYYIVAPNLEGVKEFCPEVLEIELIEEDIIIINKSL